MPLLASLAGALPTSEAGYFDTDPATFAKWLCALGHGHRIQGAGVESAAQAAELVAPDGPLKPPPLLVVRTIVASNDGGRWVFETSGDPLPFEDQAAYAAPRKSDRLPPALLLSYLSQLGVPIDVEPNWTAGLLVSG